LRLSWFTIKKRYEVIEINTMPDFLVFITWFSRLLGSKVVLYMFEDMPSLFMSSYHTSPKHVITRILSFFEKWSAKYADHVIVSDGDHYKQKLMERGIPENKITLVLNVPDTEIFSKDSISSDADKDHFRIVIVSTLVKRYGVQTVIKAIPQVTHLIPELLIDIVGDGEYKPELESMTQKLGVERHINFRGMVPYDDIPEIIAKAHVGLAPMSDDVGLPNKLFEYFALGKPAIVSQHPSIINAFGFNGTVRYFKPDDDRDLADKIVELYRNPEKRASMVEHGFHYYDKHKWSETKKKYLNVYEALLEK
jgi:glycosyltransferase involved in cell wall biosynthesis